MQTKNIEYDKQYASNMKVKGAGRRHMKEIRKDADYGGRTVRVILQFSDEPQDAMMIQEAVKSILMMELEEQIKGGSVRKGREKEYDNLSND